MILSNSFLLVQAVSTMPARMFARLPVGKCVLKAGVGTITLGMQMFVNSTRNILCRQIRPFERWQKGKYFRKHFKCFHKRLPSLAKCLQLVQKRQLNFNHYTTFVQKSHLVLKYISVIQDLPPPPPRIQKMQQLCSIFLQS